MDLSSRFSVYLESLDTGNTPLLDTIEQEAREGGVPVIRKETELVVCVAGMSALGRPLREACFRWELLPETLRDGGRIITVEDMVLILGSEWGGRKGTSGIPFRVFLNQCDTEKQRESAMRILELLRVRWGVDGDCGALQNGAVELLHWTNCPKSTLKDI